MENKEILQQFNEIEQKIGMLIEASKTIETQNAELRKKIDTLEKELEGKAKIEKSYLEERDLIRTKIDNLLGRLQEITESSA